MLTRSHIAALALALIAPCAASATPVGTFTWIASGPGDQTDPAIDGRYVLYADDARGSFDVLARDLVTGATRTVASGPGAEDSPDIARSVVAYRSTAGVTVAYLATGALLREPAEPGARAPAVSTSAAVWEVGREGSRDIGWFLFGGGAPRSGVIGGPGDQRAPAVSGAIVAYIDVASGGSVRIQDLSRGEARVVSPGGATGVAIDGGPGALRIAVTRDSDAGTDVEVYDGAGALLAALPLPGEQRSPHLAGEWVAFEDLSSGRSQVMLWEWRTGLVHTPRSSAADQILSDLFVDEDAVRVAFAERTSGGLDVGLYTLPLPLADDGTNGLARCEDPDAVLLAELLLARGPGASTTGALAFSAGEGADLPILVCVDAVGISSASVTLDGEVIAAPEDLGSGSAHLESRRVAWRGEGLLEAMVEGKRGASLRVRVLADPARAADGSGPGTPEDPGDGGGAGGGSDDGGRDDDDGPGKEPDPADADDGGGLDGPGGDADSGDAPTLPGRGGCASGGVDPLAIAGALALLRLRRRAARGEGRG